MTGDGSVGAWPVGVAVAPVDVGVAVGVWLGEDGLPLGAGLADREGLVVGDEPGDRVGAGEYGLVYVGAGVLTGTVAEGVGSGLTVTAAWVTGRTQMYSANTPANSPSSTSVEVRGRALTGCLPLPGWCRVRWRR
ncbi:MAG TPA: hypothetical protein VGM12_27035 [Trebonia sp.]|jgi:hypothetical protein